MTIIDREMFKGHFNSGGYVLNFTTADFDSFTARVVGVPLCQKYGLSKGKSLGRFLDEASDSDSVKLCKALLDYEEACFPSVGISAEEKGQRQKLRAVLESEEGAYSALQPIDAAISQKGPEYVRSLSARAKQDLESGSLDSALTKARTLLEEAFCHAIEAVGHEPKSRGNITDLEGQFKALYSMRQSGDNDTRINDLITGAGKIVASIAALRNIGGDAHGLGSKRFKIESHYAKLCLNAATVVAEFVLDIVERHKSKVL